MQWTASFKEPWTCTRKDCLVLHFVEVTRQVEIEHATFQRSDGPMTFAYVLYDNVGTWPGTESHEWIEVVW